MKVILNQDVYNLGEEGDICNVKRGYARNYLIPKDLAFPYTKQIVAIFDAKREKIEQRKKEKREAAHSLRDKLEGLELAVKMPAGDTGKLFGAVTNLTIAEELAKNGLTIERKKIELPQHNLKMVGNYTVRVKLYENEVAELKIAIEALEDTKSSAGSSSMKSSGKTEEASTVEETAEAPAADEAVETPEVETVEAPPAEAAEETEEEAEETTEEADAAGAPSEATEEAPADEIMSTADSEATTLSSESDGADESEPVDSETEAAEEIK